MATAAGDVFKEFQALARNIDKLTDGQAVVELYDNPGDNPEVLVTFLLSVSPNAGHYKGALVKFKVVVNSGYPAEAPEVICLNSVYHPNIDICDDRQARLICVNILGEDWQPEVGLDGCVIAILFLFHHPNKEDSITSVFPRTQMNDEEFAANVRASLKGDEVAGICFDTLLIEDGSNNKINENVTESRNEITTDDASVQIRNDIAPEDGQNEQESVTAPEDLENVTIKSTPSDASSDRYVHSEMPKNNAMT